MMLPRIYRGATRLLSPGVRFYLDQRCRRGKEDPARLGERFGKAGSLRPKGRLVWIHAASVGEALSMLALIERLRRDRPEVEILVTTATVASARLLERRLPPGARHQFVPVDLPDATQAFLDHWRPDMAIWVESELWPNLILTARARGIPMALLNARMSARSFARWRRWPGLIRPVISTFAFCLAQDEVQATRLRRLGARDVVSIGDLKAAAESLPVDRADLADLRLRMAGRPIWLAASTHEGEESAAGEVHRRLAARHPSLLTLIAPRHPVRADAIAAMLADAGLRVARRSRRETPTPATDIYLIDTLGELGLFYRLAGIAFIGKSLTGKGGHNPLEAARLDCAVLHGPDMSNCAVMSAALDAAGAAETVASVAELAEAVSILLGDPARRDQRVQAGRKVAAAGREVLETALARLEPMLDWLGRSEPGTRSEPPLTLRA